ncbi:dihydrofolate reductase family protein [Leekyejoonella antrihumi]|uniref:Pyrimidine reductase family protein n=1 Tax=Leekyejoonella antrihumi TaxID=1660198 RepID=A0A563E6C8_9MICO|nr:dihydrofolate reductase family protein [Leekyejoonella antrihumi]TWP37859.1 pyrimidine reductase family protein [Leekyejoonella antrihumi]
MNPIRAIYGNRQQGDDLTDQEVARAYPWPDSRRWVRAMMVTTLDGAAAGADGLSGSVSSNADQLVFDAVRRYADAVLIGSGTLRAEQYTPMRANPEDAKRRAADGQLAAPVVAVVTGSLQLPWELPIWSESAHRPVVITRADANEGRLATARDHADVIALQEVTPEAVVDALAGRGLRRILCEGGPSLLRDLVAADLVDEADITLAPLFAGTSGSPSTTVLPDVADFRLEQVLEGDGTLMMRYLAPGR